MTRTPPEMRLGVARDDDGALYIPAQQVTGLLRGLAGQWQDWGHDGEQPVLDRDTLQLLTAALRDAADQIDVECIARTRVRHGHRDGEAGRQ